MNKIIGKIGLKRVIAIALRSIMARKMRSFLTILGIIIGITSVVGMTGLLRGLDSSMKAQITALNPNVFYISRMGGQLYSPNDWPKIRKRPAITRQDAEALERALPNIEEIAIILDPKDGGQTVKSISYGNNSTKSIIIAGVSHNYANMAQDDIAYGRFFTESEEMAGSKVVVLGTSPSRTLFGGMGATHGGVGKEVKLGGEYWRVIGVLAARPSLMGDDEQNNAFALVPCKILEMDFASDDLSYQLAIRPKDGVNNDELLEEAVSIMRYRRGLRVEEDNNFDILTQDSILAMWKNMTRTISIALIVLSSIALLVGGIGVMAVMLVTVTERTAEIGIRMAVGARKRDILLQFMIEAGILTFIGGLFGIFIGVGIGFIFKAFTGLPVSFPLWSYAISLISSALIGIVFGTYPAWRGAKMDPVVALSFKGK